MAALSSLFISPTEGKFLVINPSAVQASQPRNSLVVSLVT